MRTAKLAPASKSKKSLKNAKDPGKVNAKDPGKVNPSDSHHLRKLIEAAKADPDGTIRYGSAGKNQDTQEKKTPEFVCEISSENAPDNLVPESVYANVIQTGCNILGLCNKELRGILSKFGCGDATKALPILRDDNTRPLLMDYLKKHCPTSNNRGETINPVMILNAVHHMQKTAFSGDPMLASEIEELSKCWSKEDSGSAPVTEEEAAKEILSIRKAYSDKRNLIIKDMKIDEDAMFNEQRKFKPTEVTDGNVTVNMNNEGGTPVSNSELMNRARKAGEILEIPSKVIMETLHSNGIKDNQYGIKLLESATVTLENLMGALGRIQWVGVGENNSLGLKAAATVLKGQDPFSKTPESPKAEETVASILRDLKPIEQRGDRELLEQYNQDRGNYAIEQELNRRARGQRFIVLEGDKPSPGKESIDVDASLELLKKTRRITVPSMMPGANGKVKPIYRITELNPEDRIVELCPLCGETLYKGYCEKCTLNFSGIGDDERAYVKLISGSSTFNYRTHSDRKAVHASASKGLEDLRITWPSIQVIFDELKLTGNLPKLRVLKNLPSEQVEDPFHVSGNRNY